MDNGDGKESDQDDEEDCSGRRRDTSTPLPETTAAQVPGRRRTRLITNAVNLSHFSFFGTYQWICSLVGVDVVKISGYSVKSG